MTLQQLVRGSDDLWILTAERAATAYVIALDLTTCTAVDIYVYQKGSGTALITKGIGSGVTVIDANTAKIAIEDTDTISIAGTTDRIPLSVEVWVTESDGRRVNLNQKPEVTSLRLAPVT